MENSFDIHAATWDENPKRINLVKKVSDLIFSKLDLNNKQILDYGSGTGLLGYHLIEKAGHVTFCDTSEGMLEQVKKKKEHYGFKNITIVKADLLKDYIPETFDFIFSMLVLHHVEDIKGLLLKFYDQLKKDGVLCWIDLDKEDGSFHGDQSIPHFGFEKNLTMQLLKEAGFETTFYTNELTIQKEVENELRDFSLFVLIAKKE
jgi:ubiquinone/menaquinone biosynthesis C-methylase UbiE